WCTSMFSKVKSPWQYPVGTALQSNARQYWTYLSIGKLLVDEILHSFSLSGTAKSVVTSEIFDFMKVSSCSMIGSISRTILREMKVLSCTPLTYSIVK